MRIDYCCFLFIELILFEMNAMSCVHSAVIVRIQVSFHVFVLLSSAC